MSQDVTRNNAHLAFARPEPSAGRADEAVVLQWLAWRSDQRRLASFNLEHSIRSHRLTARAAKLLNSLPTNRATAVRRALETFLEAAMNLDTESAPPLRADLHDDGSVLIEWTFKDRRFGLSFEEEEGESGWYFVFSREPSTRYEAGTMDQLDMPRMVKLTLNP